MLTKESIFYKTHSMSRLPVNFFLFLKVMIYVMKYGSLGKRVSRESENQGRKGCFDTNQRFSSDTYKSSTLMHNNKSTTNISHRGRKQTQRSSSRYVGSKGKLVLAKFFR